MNKSRDTKRPGKVGMRLGYVGLGKMGFNMVERLLEKGYEPVVFDVNKDALKEAASLLAEPAADLKSLAEALASPRLIWLMIPHTTVDEAMNSLVRYLGKGDTIIDGGNSYYKDSMRRAESLAEKGIDFLDVGVSGGPAGARSGSCIMVGGKKESFAKYEGLFRDLSVKDGYGYMGGHGAGHFVKMVHNGIEYGMMQALAEGFTIMKQAPFHLDLREVAVLYNHGSVITSRLVGWLKEAFEEYGQGLDSVSGTVVQSGEGMWTVEAGREYGVSAPVIEGSVSFRTFSQDHPSYTGQVLSALRNQFGSHDVFKK
ncbi:MAG: phosphogluconate dehydrogenase (NAD(+)-dependent, decarboxylating) [Desulfomonilia bacterium]|jgi:6-phosphogluconate dehydrogenase